MTQYGESAAMLAAIYDRSVRQVTDVASRFSFTILMRADDGTTPYFAALIRVFTERYLQGIGHLPDARGRLVSDEEFSKEVNNRLLQANLLLRAVSDNDMLPSIDSWRIKVNALRALRDILFDTVLLSVAYCRSQSSWSFFAHWHCQYTTSLFWRRLTLLLGNKPPPFALPHLHLRN
jgi:hypothetical protein